MLFKYKNPYLAATNYLSMGFFKTILLFGFTMLLSSCFNIHQDSSGFFHKGAYYQYSGEQETGNWTNGKRNGYFKTINSDRNLLNKGNYQMGTQTGEWHYFHPNNSIQSRGSFKNGTRTGQWEFYYPSGQIKEMRSFNNKQNLLLYSWETNGKEMVVNGNGPYRFYFKDVLRESGQYSNGLPSGNWEIFDESGTLIREFTAGE